MKALEKQCPGCGEVKPWTEFHKGINGRPRSRCKICIRSYNNSSRVKFLSKRRAEDRARPRRERKKDLERASKLKREYNITPEGYLMLLIRQGGVCAICKLPEAVKRQGKISITLAVDHDHKTGKIRGLLCNKCNLLLGKVGDSPDILRSAICYLDDNAEVR